jgi:hypothetical protein
MADGDSKGMARVNLADNSSLILVANNNGKLQSYQTAKGQKLFPVDQNDGYAIIHKKDGSSFKQELYFGSTYLSSSSRMLTYSAPVDTIIIYSNKGMKKLSQ